jgi:hypothetical protein
MSITAGQEVEPGVGIEPTTYRLQGDRYMTTGVSTSTDRERATVGSGLYVQHQHRFVSHPVSRDRQPLAGSVFQGHLHGPPTAPTGPTRPRPCASFPGGWLHAVVLIVS